jgi:hypothetical protein
METYTWFGKDRNLHLIYWIFFVLKKNDSEMLIPASPSGISIVSVAKSSRELIGIIRITNHVYSDSEGITFPGLTG